MKISIPPSFFKLKIRTKIIIVYSVLGFLTLIAVNLIWLLPSLNEVKQNASAVQLEIAKKGVIEIESFLKYKTDSLEKLTYFLEPNASSESNRSILDRFLQKDQAFFEIALIDKFGQEKLKVSQLEIFTDAELTNKSENEYFKAAIGGKFYMSEVFFSEKAEPFLILAAPIFSSQKEVSGILTAKIKLLEMWRVISGLNTDTSSHIFVVDDKGRLIADQNPSLVLKNLILIDRQPVKNVVQKREIVTGLGAEDRYLGDQNRWFLAVGVPFENLPWGLLIERPESEAYAGLTNKFVAFVLISILGGAVIIFAASWLSNYLSRPLKRLGEGAKIIGSGNLNFRLNITTGDEIEDLARAFNEMAEQLKESYLFLERKVDERTKEFKIQRDQLSQTTKNLIQRDIALSEIREQEEKALGDAVEAKAKAEEARLATLNILEDIDEAKKAQETEKNKVEAIIKSLTDGLIMLDGFDKISLINEELQAMLNIKKDDFLSKNLMESDDANFKKISELIKKGNGQIDKKEILLEGPDERVLEVSTAPVTGADNEILGKLVILHDITREKAIEKMKSEFVTITAHQLRTPLSAIKWTLRLVLDHDLGPISKEQENILKKGYQSNERMINLVNDLLNVTRIEEGRFIYGFEPVSFVELAEEIIEGFATLLKMRNINLKLEKPKDNKISTAVDREKMKLALQNLIENAIIYSSDGSTVTISLDCDKMNLRFAIHDQGMGVPENQQSRLFTKFFRGSNAIKMETEGTGLGLFLTKNIIEKHGGKIWFESQKGKGTTFYFALPLKNN